MQPAKNGYLYALEIDVILRIEGIVKQLLHLVIGALNNQIHGGKLLAP